jgi:FixJ family two-component response regulator
MNENRGPATSDRSLIAIVEDDPSVRRSLQLLFKGQGFEVRAYPSGEALTSSDAFSDAACLVSDYKLDALDGIALLSHLRAQGWQGPAVLITGFPSAQLSERAANSGYAAVFDKPLCERSLIETVLRLVRAVDGLAGGTHTVR